MSDDEEIIYKKPQKTIHYGTLENSEWLKQPLEDIQSDEDEYEPESKKPATAATSTVPPPSSSSGANINISSEYFDLEQEM